VLDDELENQIRSGWTDTYIRERPNSDDVIPVPGDVKFIELIFDLRELIGQLYHHRTIIIVKLYVSIVLYGLPFSNDPSCSVLFVDSSPFSLK